MQNPMQRVLAIDLVGELIKCVTNGGDELIGEIDFVDVTRGWVLEANGASICTILRRSKRSFEINDESAIGALAFRSCSDLPSRSSHGAVVIEVVNGNFESQCAHGPS